MRVRAHRLVRSLVLAVALTAAVGMPHAPAAGVQTGAVLDGLERAVMRLPRSADHTTAVPAHLPAPAMASNIGPGSHLLIEMADEPDAIFACTANFVWSSGTNRYLGAAGHCFIPETKTATHGTGADYNASRTTVKVCVSGCTSGGLTGFIVTGTTVALGPLVYARASAPDGEDIGNDFGIVQIPSAHLDKIRPSMPVWGGPTTTTTPASITGTPLCLYGNGVVVGETFPTMARAGIGVAKNTDYWLADMPSLLGDSGSAVQTCGQHSGGFHGIAAVGALTHLSVGTGITAGTTMARAILMTSQDRGIAIAAIAGS